MPAFGKKVEDLFGDVDGTDDSPVVRGGGKLPKAKAVITDDEYDDDQAERYSYGSTSLAARRVDGKKGGSTVPAKGKRPVEEASKPATGASASKKAPTSGSDEDDGLDGGKVEHQPRGPAPKQLYTGKDLDKEFEDAEVVTNITVREFVTKNKRLPMLAYAEVGSDLILQDAKGDRFSLTQLSAGAGADPESKAKDFARALLQRLYYKEVLMDFNVRPGQNVKKSRLPFPVEAYEMLKECLHRKFGKLFPDPKDSPAFFSLAGYLKQNGLNESTRSDKSEKPKTKEQLLKFIRDNKNQLSELREQVSEELGWT